jgi:hypothetical protein
MNLISSKLNSWSTKRCSLLISRSKVCLKLKLKTRCNTDSTLKSMTSCKWPKSLTSIAINFIITFRSSSLRRSLRGWSKTLSRLFATSCKIKRSSYFRYWKTQLANTLIRAIKLVKILRVLQKKIVLLRENKLIRMKSNLPSIQYRKHF